MPIRIATLNIWNRLGPWEQRLEAIRAALSVENVDVLALQEVVLLEGFDQAALIAEGFNYHFVHGRHSEAKLPIGNALLSRLPIAKHEVFDLPTGGTVERRSLLHAELRAPFGAVHDFNTHLNWRLDEGHVREAQVRFVCDTITRVCPSDVAFPPILMGDLNADPDADEIRFLRGLTSLGGRRVYFSDVWLYAGGGAGATFSRRNPFTTVAREPDRRIDYILLRWHDDRMRGEPVDARVAFDAQHNGVFPSDHFGVVATIAS